MPISWDKIMVSTTLNLQLELFPERSLWEHLNKRENSIKRRLSRLTGIPLF
jgi:hypothetical protein